MTCRKELAIAYFKQGYNCSQSVVLAFKDLVNIDEKTLLKLASTFGGGMSRLREVCGAVSGMNIVLGLLYGYDAPETGEVKANLYSRVQELALKFEEKNDSIVCRELMHLETKHDSPIPTPRTNDFYTKRPCLNLIGYASEILEEYINTHPVG